MNDDELKDLIARKSALADLGRLINLFDEAVDSGSIDRQLNAGKQLRDTALTVAQLHSEAQ